MFRTEGGKDFSEFESIGGWSYWPLGRVVGLKNR